MEKIYSDFLEAIGISRWEDVLAACRGIVEKSELFENEFAGSEGFVREVSEAIALYCFCPKEGFGLRVGPGVSKACDLVGVEADMDNFSHSFSGDFCYQYLDMQGCGSGVVCEVLIASVFHCRASYASGSDVRIAAILNCMREISKNFTCEDFKSIVVLFWEVVLENEKY